jgi:Molybdopterin-binding domain of aldehyde dehydrogenase
VFSQVMTQHGIEFFALSKAVLRQRPFGVRTEVADTFGIPEERVRVIVPDTGGAYGGKHSGECGEFLALKSTTDARVPSLGSFSRQQAWNFPFKVVIALIYVEWGVTPDPVSMIEAQESRASPTVTPDFLIVLKIPSM